MTDFFRGSMGCLLQGILFIAGFVFIALSLMSCGADATAQGTLFLVLAILCWCAIAGIRFWLRGHIFKR